MADRSEDRLFFLKVFCAFFAAIFIIFVLRELRQICIPFFIALLFYFLLNGIMRKLVARNIPKSVILIGLLLIIFISLFLLGLLIFTGVTSFIDNFPAYSEKITRMARSLSTSLNLPILDVKKYVATINWDKTFDPVQITSLVSMTMGNFTSFIGNLLLVLLLLLFMLGEKVPMVTRVVRTMSSKRGEDVQRIEVAINSGVQHYLFVKTLMSLITAALAALILLVGRVDFVIFCSLLIFFFNYIPTVGSLIGTFFPVMFAFLKYGFGPHLLLVTAALMVMGFVMGNVVEPQVMGRSLDLSPIVIVLSLIFWGWLWGVVGMFLAVPLSSSLKIIFENIPALKPLAAAMSGE